MNTEGIFSVVARLLSANLSLLSAGRHVAFSLHSFLRSDPDVRETSLHPSWAVKELVFTHISVLLFSFNCSACFYAQEGSIVPRWSWQELNPSSECLAAPRREKVNRGVAVETLSARTCRATICSRWEEMRCSNSLSMHRGSIWLHSHKTHTQMSDSGMNVQTHRQNRMISADMSNNLLPIWSVM